MRLLLAILWELWRLQRVTLIGMALSLGAMTACARLVPPEIRADWLTTLAQVLMAGSLLVVFAGFTFTETHRQLKQAVFPVRLFTLPVPTSVLVLTPMLTGAAAAGLVYAAWVGLVLHPLDHNQPFIEPVLVLMTGLLAYQAVMWGLADYRLMRLIICGSIGGLLLWVLILPEGVLPELITRGTEFERLLKLGVLLGGVNVGVISLTWRNITRQRHRPTAGTPRSAGSTDRDQPAASARQASFRSSTRAQLWLEWRRNGWIMPGLAAFLGIVVAFPVPWLTGLEPAGAFNYVVGSALAVIILAILVGKGFAVPDFWTRDLSLPPFVAIRPLGSGEWVFIRLRLAAVCAVLAGCFVLAGVAVGLSVTSSWAGLWSGIAPADSAQAAAPRWLVLAGYGAVLMLLVWRSLVISLYNGLTGRTGPFLAATVGTFVVQLLFVPWLLFRHWHEVTPYNTSIHWRPLVWIIAGAWFLKLLAAWWAWSKCRQARLVSGPALAGYLACWLGAVLTLSTFLLTVLPVDQWVRQLAAFAAGLVVPLARIGLAPVAFSLNRHRRISAAPPGGTVTVTATGHTWRPSLRAAPVLGAIVLVIAVTVTLTARRLERLVPQFIAIDGQTYRALISGSGSPTVVLEGDMEATLKAWAPIQQALARDFRVLAYERAGFGGSPASTRPPTLAQNAAALAEILQRQEIHDPLVLVGAHIGAAYARVFASTFPDRVDGIVLLEPSDGETSAEVLAVLNREHPELADPLVAFLNEINPLYRPYATRQLLAIEQELALADPASAGAIRPERWQSLKTEKVYMKTYQYTRADPGAQAEFRQLDSLLVEQRAARWPEVPLVVMTGTKLGLPSQLERESLQPGSQAAKLDGRNAWLASLPAAVHVVMPEAGDDLIGGAPDQVIQQIRKLVDQLRSQ